MDLNQAAECNLGQESTVSRLWSQWAVWLSGGLIVAAALAVYANSLSGVFIYDDPSSIADNASIRNLTAVGDVLSPPRDGQTVSGRPVLNLSLAINYALGGTSTWGYHATNLAIHIFNAILLLGILRRTFLRPRLRDRLGDAALGLAVAITLLWTLHPLQTESVTYIVQRAESLAGLFYLLTLYGLIRGAEAERGIVWYVVAVVACWLGMGTKEIMVTVPVTALLYDVIFLGATWRETLRRRWGFYLALFASWTLLFAVVAATGLMVRANELGATDPWSYMRSQPGVILHYLRLSVWPTSLCLDCEWPVATTMLAILPPMLLVGMLALATVWGVIGRKTWAFLGAWFFLILAPSSSIMPCRQLAFEHRMYLSLAAVMAALVVGAYLGCQAMTRRGWLPGRAQLAGEVCLVGLVAGVLGFLTFQRNDVYQSEISVWEDTVSKAPHNARAYSNLGNILSAKRDFQAALVQYQKALELRPDLAGSHSNLGNTLAYLGRIDAAEACYQKAIEIDPNFADPQNNLASLFARRGEFEQAKLHYQRALQIKPDYPEAHNNLANIFARRKQLDAAIPHYREALKLKPDYAEAHNNLGFALASIGQVDEAIEHYQKSVEFNPTYALAHYNLANALYRQGRLAAAIPHWRDAVRLQPNHGGMVNQLAWVLATSPSRDGTAAVHLAEHAVRLTVARDPRALRTLAAAYAETGRFAEAKKAANDALRMASDTADTSLADALRTDLQAYVAEMPLRESALR